MILSRFFIFLLSFQTLIQISCGLITQQERNLLRDEAKEMFYHAFNNYMSHAFPSDELKPISCTARDPIAEPRGHLDAVLGDFCLTLVDSLDTLAVMGDIKGFERGLRLLEEHLNFDKDITVSVFEATIRVLGGLISNHVIAERFSSQFSEPYEGTLLKASEDLGNRLLVAFNTPTGLPLSRINLRHGIRKGQTLEISTAEVGTLLLEFGSLSRLTNQPKFEEAAVKALMNLWNRRTNLNLLGSLLSVSHGKWINLNSGIGAGFDSFFEYLLKSYILFGDSKYFEMFQLAYESVNRYMNQGGWFLEVHMNTAQVVKESIDALQAFWPGVQVLVGDIDEAVAMHKRLHSIWKTWSCLPEGFHVRSNSPIPSAGGYPLRPEFVESTYFLYQATKSDYYLEVGRDILFSLQNITRVACGFASIADVNTKRLEDRMDSYFLAETLKYLYLLFDGDNPLHSQDFVFTTEGHILPLDLFPSSSSRATPSSFVCPVKGSSLVEVTAPPPITNSYCNNDPPGIKIQIVDPPASMMTRALVRVKRPSLIAGDFFASPASFGPLLNITGVEGLVEYGTPFDGCETLRNAGELEGKIVLLDRGGCNFLEKVKNAQNGGAIGVIVANNQPTSHLFAMSADVHLRNSVSIPSVLISYHDAEIMKAHLPFEVAFFATEPFDLPQLFAPVPGQEAVFSHSGGESVVFLKPSPGLALNKLSSEQFTQWIINEMNRYGMEMHDLSKRLEENTEESP